MPSRPLSQYYGHLGPTGGLDSSWHGITPLDSAGPIGIAGISVTSGLNGIDLLRPAGALRFNQLDKPFASSSPTITVQSGGGESEESSTTGPRWE